MKKLFFLLLLLFLVFSVYKLRHSSTPVTYESVLPNAVVKIFEENVGAITNLKITPDNNYLLTTDIKGTVSVYPKVKGVFRKQTTPFFQVATSQPGFPPLEAGLTGLFFGADFAESGDVFLTYSYAVSKDELRNRVTRVTFTKDGTQVYGREAQMIFEANTAGSASHQIQDGVGVMVKNQPHIMFTIGEGHIAERALDPKEEAGKLILLKRDGTVADGKRPYPASPKVQAIGIRNAPPMTLNPKTGKVMLADTGPDNYDRLIYGNFFTPDANNDRPFSFNWAGTEESLAKPVLSPYENTLDIVMHRWSPTQTAVSLAFYDNPRLPNLPDNSEYFLVTLFGKTGSLKNEPGKTILLGTLKHGNEDNVTLTPFIKRASSGEGKLGHPIGLAVDNESKRIYFGDILEGRIYQIDIN